MSANAKGFRVRWWMWLVLSSAMCLLLGGCAGEGPRPPQGKTGPQPQYAAPTALLCKSSSDADLALTAWHRVISPQEIRGVIVLRHVGIEPVSLVDRWNSSGAHQWSAVVDGRETLSNPQQAWERNGFTASVLSDHRSWAVPFVLQAHSASESDAWQFLPGPAAGLWIDGTTGQLHSDPPIVGPFTTPTRIQLVLDAQRAEEGHAHDGKPQPRRFLGQLCATSTLVDTAEALAGHLLDADGKPLPMLQ